MVLRRMAFLRRAAVPALLAALLALSAGPAAAGAAEEPAPGEVTLTLAEYAGLVGKVERLDEERAAAEAGREAPLAVVVAQRTTVVWGDEVAEIGGHFEALIQGSPQALLLPFAGLAASAEVTAMGSPAGSRSPGSVTSAGAAGGVDGFLLVAPAAGRYAIDVRGWAAPANDGGIRRLTLAPVVAPMAEIAEIDIDLPADLAWSAPGGVVVLERTAGSRRLVRLAAQRGAAQTLEVQRRLAGTEAEKLLAQSVVLTLFQLRPEGLRRHDVVLYQVARGGLADLAVELPAGLSADQVATDEGDAVPVLDGRRLTVHRKRQLQGVGYLLLTSTPAAALSALSARSVVPDIEVRGRYLAFASSVAADARPLPAASWTRVDVSDLPDELDAALSAVAWTAAWRLAGETPGEAPGLGFEITALPPSPLLPTVVRDRDTLSLLTVDGTVLHRDRFTLAQQGASLDLALPAGATLWSILVDGQPVRAVERGADLSIPLALAQPGKLAEIEVVTVVERRLAMGRAALDLDLPQVAVPVLTHQWRLLLPEGASYRFVDGALPPAHEGGGSTFDGGSILQAGLVLTVLDDQGAAVPGATVLLWPAGSTEPVVLITSAEGRIHAANMVPGTYSVQVESTGFATFEHPDVALVAHRTATLEVNLTTAVEETITVLAPINPGERPGVYRPGGDGGRRKAILAAEAAHQAFQQGAAALTTGLVSGVKPLPIEIPQSGKALLLAGALPPPRVHVSIAVQGKD